MNLSRPLELELRTVATRAGVLSATTLGGVTLGGVFGGLVGLPADLTQTLSAIGAVMGMVAGAITGAVALSAGWAGAPNRIDLRKGDLVNGWRVIKIVTAQGSTGPVHLVRRDHQYGIMKSIHQDDQRIGNRAGRLLAEAQAVSAVDSHYVARLLDSGEVGARSYLVYQYAGDHTLDDYATTASSLPANEAAESDQRLWGIANSMAVALKDVHNAQLVHQDVSPPNVSDRGDWGVLLDLGMARLNQELLGTSTRETVTLDYAPPERLRPGYRALPASDVYQWAACVLRVATGQRPYSQTSPEGVVQAIVSAPPDVTNTPTWIQPVLRSALQADPARRPSAEALVTELRSVGQARGWKPAPVTSAKRPKPGWSLPSEYRAAAISGAACALFLVAGNVASSNLGTESDGPTAAQSPPTVSTTTTSALPLPTTPTTTSPTTTELPTTTAAPTTAAPTTAAPTTAAPTTAAPTDRWPTSSSEAPSTLYAMFGVEATEGLRFPDWSSCEGQYCLVGRGEDIHIYDGAQRLGTLILEPGKSPLDELLEAGFSETEAAALLNP